MSYMRRPEPTGNGHDCKVRCGPPGSSRPCLCPPCDCAACRRRLEAVVNLATVSWRANPESDHDAA